MSAKKYIDHLYNKDLDGYIQVMQLKDGKAIKVLNTCIKGIVEVVHEQQGQLDTYITPNTFYKPGRSNDSIRQFRALYIDIDLKKYSKTEAFYKIQMKTMTGEIPKPTMIVDSGRGLHCYWRIEHAPKGAVYTWQQLEDYLYKHLKELGADLGATDSARILRLPSTINSKNGAMCEVLEDNDNTYSMYELREKYLNYVKKEYVKKEKLKADPVKAKVRNLFNSYTLHIARAEDMETLIKLRNYDLKGYRNSLIHCYCYWKGIYIREQEALFDTVSKLNNDLKDPLRNSEIKTIVRSTTKAIEGFISYEQGIRSGENKRVSKAMRERGGYWYTNETLINRLDITEKEQQHLKTIIGSKEKNKRKNKRRFKDRRNKQGLTPRQQKKMDNISTVKKLYSQDLTQVEISKKLGLHQSNISRILNNEY